MLFMDLTNLILLVASAEERLARFFTQLELSLRVRDFTQTIVRQNDGTTDDRRGKV